MRLKRSSWGVKQVFEEAPHPWIYRNLKMLCQILRHGLPHLQPQMTLQGDSQESDVVFDSLKGRATVALANAGRGCFFEYLPRSYQLRIRFAAFALLGEEVGPSESKRGRRRRIRSQEDSLFFRIMPVICRCNVLVQM